ncbi:MAG: peptidase M48 [Elusimicrobia bacterium RIFOXYB2_FULL_50_12]|nr:MAG: peptidase M48 [Elusimicrobia bacterium RIFOXYB2_FULL_50_12]
MKIMKCFLVSALVGVIIGGCATVPITGRRQLSFIPQSQLTELSNSNYRELLSQSRLSTDKKKIDQLNTIGRRIAGAAEQFLRENGRESDIKSYSWEFTVIDDSKTINAFAMPGGKVAAYTGILPLAQDDDGLAVVIGHEVAHAIANHGNERMSQMLLVQLGGMTLAQAIKQKPERTQELLFLAYGVGTNIGVLLPYSREHETEADRIGLILMARAGFDPRAAVPFWERMKAKSGGRPPEFLSTHPAPERRIEDLKKFMPEALEFFK